MENVICEEIDEALTRAFAIQDMSDDYLDVVIPQNESAINKRESTGPMPLDDQPYGEEIIRVEEILPELDKSIELLNSMRKSPTPNAEMLQKICQSLNNAEATLEDIGAEDVIRASKTNHDSDFFDNEEE